MVYSVYMVNSHDEYKNFYGSFLEQSVTEYLPANKWTTVNRLFVFCRNKISTQRIYEHDIIEKLIGLKLNSIDGLIYHKYGFSVCIDNNDVKQYEDISRELKKKYGSLYHAIYYGNLFFGSYLHIHNKCLVDHAFDKSMCLLDSKRLNAFEEYYIILRGIEHEN